MRILVVLLLFLSTSFFLSASVPSESNWQQVYNKLRAEDTQLAFQFLQQQVNTLPPGSERIYVGATLARTAIALKKSVSLNEVIIYSDNLYDDVLQHIVSGLVVAHENLYSQTMHEFKQAIAKAYELEEPAVIATVELFYINVKISLANYVQLTHHIKEVERNVQKMNDQFWGVNSLHNVKALNANFNGDHVLAIEMYQQAIANTQYEANKAPYYNNLALTYLDLGKFDDATKYLTKSLELRKLQNNEYKVALTMLNLGIVANRANQYQEALMWLDKAYQLYVKFDNAYRKAYALVQKAKVFTNLKQTTKASDAINTALSLISVTDNINLITDIRIHAAENMQTLGETNKAIIQAQIAHDLAMSVNDKAHLIRSLELLAELAAKQSDFEQAYQYSNQLLFEKEQLNAQKSMQAMIALESELEVTAQQLKNVRLEKNNNLQQQHISRLEERQQYHAIIIFFSLVLLFLSLRGYNKHKYRAQHDNLTDALNRGAFVNRITRVGAPAIGKKHGLVLFDLDHFKQVNDLYGHPTGDLVLEKTAELVNQFFPKSTLFARFGGEEFMLFVPSLSDKVLFDLVDEFRQKLSMMTMTSEAGKTFTVTASFSLLTYQNNVSNLDKIYSKLDVGLYQAKSSGRNCIIMA
ncbi:diguanylate cyclase [Pseudoalteromonas sp. SMS1]|uniref:GGDEF domain-containing protein n=1 Tax=Pseudoalteromonas sp. SMS1 TaxID=2908894 RepID=UPI001F182C34|nr:tetratricopeptide repeat-containing diguanylate cyclase [Pseudoalteromonas sp. SMS1]MCF2858639.1 diguanylate cyclase [Pseudoalteromonas sp. SMS1]